MIDIGRAVQHPTEDQNWASKLGIGALIYLVPVLNFALAGYAIEHIRNTSSGMDVPLPPWEGIADKLTDGLKLLVITSVLALPIAALSCIFAVLAGGLVALSGNDESVSGAAAAGFGAIALVLSCLIFLYGLFLAYLSPAVYIRYTRIRDIKACLRIGELFSISRVNTGDYLLIFVMVIAAALIIGLVIGILSIIPCLGQLLSFVIIILAVPYLAVVFANLCGQYMRNNNIL